MHKFILFKYKISNLLQRNRLRRRYRLLLCYVKAYIRFAVVLMFWVTLFLRNANSGDKHIKESKLEELKVTQVDCSKIIQGDADEILKGEGINATDLPVPRDDFGYYMELRNGCLQFKENLGHLTMSMTEEEMEFPFAMSIIFYKNVHHIVELLEMVYRPHNYYCLHVDQKARNHVLEVARLLADCFENIVVPEDSVLIERHGHTNLITPEIICMYELLKLRNWRYFINLTGQEFPIKTNLEMVRIFKSLAGQNDIKVLKRHKYDESSIPQLESNAEAVGNFLVPKSLRNLRQFLRKHQGVVYQRRFSHLDSPPHGIHLLRGEPHIIASRAFVEFVTSEKRVSDLVAYLNNSYAPEESFWATINMDPNLNAPGRFKGSVSEAMNQQSYGRVKWRKTDGDKQCSGRYVKGFCVFGVRNLQHIVKHHAIVANNFEWNLQPMARMCAREWLYNRTRNEYPIPNDK